MPTDLTHIETLNWDVLSDRTLRNKSCPWIVFWLLDRKIECQSCKSSTEITLENPQAEIFSHLNEFVGEHKLHKV